MNNTTAKNPKGDRECHKIIQDLQYQIKCCKAELDLVLHQLALCRARANQRSYNYQIKPLEHNVPPHARTQNDDQFEYSQIMQGNFVLACSCTCSSSDNIQAKNYMIKNDFSGFEYPQQSHRWVNTSSLFENETVFVTNSDDDVDVHDALCCTTELEFDPQNRQVREGITMKVNQVSLADPKEKPSFHQHLLP